MKDDILTYREMCDSESVQTLQRGMNFRINSNYSVILMSQRPNAPYNDIILNDGVTIVYEGHDVPKTIDIANPKEHDQPYYTKTNKLTQNGLFAESVKRFKSGFESETIKVYEKIFSGVWSFRGFFNLVDYKYENEGNRRVFKFYLRLKDDAEFYNKKKLRCRSRLIPTDVKKEVWIRDGGKCVICGATDELHFDHVIPYSKGGSSIVAENVRILCARHNLSKSDKIE